MKGLDDQVRVAEQEVHQRAKPKVEGRNDTHHDDDEYKNNESKADQLAPSRSYYLLEFVNNLADEECHAAEGSTALRALLLRLGDDVLAGLVYVFLGHSYYLPILRLTRPTPFLTERDLQGGQDSNLQPAVLETAALPIEPPPFAREVNLLPTLSHKHYDTSTLRSEEQARESMAVINNLNKCTSS